ncbi:hypothetical protein SISNIDRAFT_454746 [Sistotremastrum niveocremeum HHB9708]|uniref:Uncharacterized protein n=2 Tax=Sistotremastraceae TaxID=3402574 RepID=A0A164UU96_9AGAM|nr:hypothetical protein SISNIDRAFT_454746 [Sistotremastrum niveocremeum HHB9708]KZT42680.1 hypothetical protein SISSUDRAFT_1041303 [Sistotremastrum suecicum HHB10207 ss-3]
MNRSLFQLDPGPLGLPSYANASSSRGRLVKRDPVLAAEQALLKQGGPAAPLAPDDYPHNFSS